jgi:hypothetical protein
MGRRAHELSPEALEAAGQWHHDSQGYREIASQLYRRRLVSEPLAAATVRRRLLDAGLAERQRRPAKRNTAR